jgi:hypothetical protein
MSRRTRFIIASGLAVGLLVTFLMWRTAWRGESTPLSPLIRPAMSASSPLSPPTATSLYSPLPVPPTGTPPVNMATLEAIRATHPTATPPSPSGIRLPYISPDIWRRWALRIFAAAGILAYIGLRLRQSRPQNETQINMDQ